MKLVEMHKAAVALAAALLALAAPAAAAGPPWGPETPPFNIEVILRDVSGGPGFGHVKFRQPSDGTKIVYLDTWVRDLAANREYELQRAVDTTLDGECTSTGWLTLGNLLEPQRITTDEGGTGRALLSRSFGALPTGMQFDIHFRVVEAGTGGATVLASGCYRFTVDQ